MNSETFIALIKEHVTKAAVANTLSVVAKPPGRRPSPGLQEAADWHSGLTEHEKDVVGEMLRQAVDSALFGLFCVLDGVRAVEDTPARGHFELHYVGKMGRTLLNDPKGEYLHDIYNR